MARITIFNTDRTFLYRQTANAFFQCVATEFVQKSELETLVVAFPGGRAIVGVLAALKDFSCELSVDYWKRLQFFMVDERIVPFDHEESNFRLLREYLLGDLLTRGLISESQIHPFPCEKNGSSESVQSYEEKLKSFGGVIDLYFVSAGEDSHIAGLFPNHHSVQNNHLGFITMEDSPKKPQHRMSASASMLSQARYAFGLFLGHEKKNAFDRYLDESVSIFECPAKLINHSVHTYVVSDLNSL